MADCGGGGAGAGRRMAEAGRKGARTMLIGGAQCCAYVSKIISDIFFLRDRHTTFYAYYKRDQSDSMVSVRASIRRDC